MTSQEIRQSFLDFFRSKEHTIVPSASLMPDSPNLLFTNAGMNQFVPVFLGQENVPYSPPRVADTQKCIRAGGKHNDLEDVGWDTYHHTFFEMLGNWSFGDYFKKEAIDWAWELITGVWQFPKHRLYATVYSPDQAAGDPSEFDQEAYDYWFERFSAAGLDPKQHIVYGDKEDNFWMMGDTGPCGPCSEIHVDLSPDGDTGGKLVNRDDPQCIEIWNLVFIQFNANPDGTFSPLAAKHVDTGMGLERVTAIMQGTDHFTNFKRIISDYETDIFHPLFERLSELSGKQYGATLPAAGTTGRSEQEKIDVAFRVIADHIRALSFAIADGILPGNTDRNYVLRRILRRAVRYGRTLGFQRPFFYELVDVLVETMGEVFPEIRSKRDLVRNTIRAEEESFNKTLDRGIEMFREEADRHSQGDELSGEFAFKLYDTYGFPLDLTELMARERGMTVDRATFERLMEQQRARARAAQKKSVINVENLDHAVATRFVGYDRLEATARVHDVVELKDNKVAVVLEESPFYAEMGGQVGDTGTITADSRVWYVVDTQKAGQAFLHLLSDQDAPEPGTEVTLAIDPDRRVAIRRHHTVTHLLHWALHEVVSPDATQKGSYVGPDKLTFDFNSAALTAEQIRDIERLVNERALEDAPVSSAEIPYDEVKKREDILQIFGEKYADQVRVIQIGGRPSQLDGFSMELCGGTHVGATGQTGVFRITNESAIASGIRRIEALAGWPAYERSREEDDLLNRLAGRLNAPISELDKKLDSVLAQQKQRERQLKTLQQKLASRTARELSREARTIGGAQAIVKNLGEEEGDFLQSVAEALKAEFSGVGVLVGASDGQVSMVAMVSSDLTSRFHAGKIIQAIAPVVGGKGGGRPEMARGGGKDAENVDRAVSKALEFIAEQP